MLVHYYHLFSGGSNWQEAVEQHVRAVNASRLDAQVFVGIVGTPEQRGAASAWLKSNWPNAVVCVEAASGYEQVTLSALRSHLSSYHFTTPVLYAHSKGAWRTGGPTEYDYQRGLLVRDGYAEALNQLKWRACLTNSVVADWKRCVDLLAVHDAVGPHWQKSFFGGNFWWATAAYLLGLPEPAANDRFDAESWVGLDDPKIFDTTPGWINHVYEDSNRCSRGDTWE